MGDARTRTVALVSMVAAVLLLVGCGGDDDRVMRLEFDGSSCNYDGPSELTPGPIELEFLNEGDGKGSVAFVRHTGDHSIQDMIDYMGDQPSTLHAPGWAVHLGTWEPVSSGHTYHWDGNLVEGVYTVVCGDRTPFHMWFGGGLTVSESFDES